MTYQFIAEHRQSIRSARCAVCEIHPLLWRPEPFGLTHPWFISNQAEVAQQKGTRKLRTNQSGINEVHTV